MRLEQILAFIFDVFLDTSENWQITTSATGPFRFYPESVTKTPRSVRRKDKVTMNATLPISPLRKVWFTARDLMA